MACANYRFHDDDDDDQWYNDSCDMDVVDTTAEEQEFGRRRYELQKEFARMKTYNEELNPITRDGNNVEPQYDDDDYDDDMIAENDERERLLLLYNKHSPKNLVYDWNEDGELVEIEEDEYVANDTDDENALKERERRLAQERREKEELLKRGEVLKSKLTWLSTKEDDDDDNKAQTIITSESTTINEDFMTTPSDSRARVNKRYNDGMTRRGGGGGVFKNIRPVRHIDIRVENNPLENISVDKKMKFKFCQRLAETGKCGDKLCGYCHSWQALRNMTRQCRFSNQCRFIDDSCALFYIVQHRQVNQRTLSKNLSDLFLCRTIIDKICGGDNNNNFSCRCSLSHDIKSCVERIRKSNICTRYIVTGECDCSTRRHDDNLRCEFKTSKCGIAYPFYLNKSIKNKVCNFVHPNEHIKNFIYRTCHK